MAVSTSEDDDNLSLDNIEEQLNEENKIVTYKWLSLSLGISSNRAKELLAKYIKQRVNDRSDDLNVVYFIGGKEKSEGHGLVDKYFLVKDSGIKDVKRRLASCTCEHIYSIQKSQLRESTILYSTDYDLVKKSLNTVNKYSGICCQDIGRPPDCNGKPETTSETKTVLSTVESEKQTEPKRQGSAVTSNKETASFFGQQSNKSRENGEKQDRSTDKQEMKLSEKQERKPKNKPELSFFGKTIKDTTDRNETKEKDKKDDKDCKERYLKDTTKTTTNKEDATELSKGLKQRKKEKNENRKEEDGMDVDEDKLDNRNRLKTAEKQTKGAKRNKKSESEEDPLLAIKSNGRMKTLSEAPVPAKRRAVIEESDSDEDQGFETFVLKSKGGAESSQGKTKKETANIKEQKEEKQKRKRKRAKEPESQSDNEEQSKSSTRSSSGEVSLQEEQKEVEKPSKRRNRRRVLKSKTFVNDDGYMVIKKVYESESGSEESEKEMDVDKAPNASVDRSNATIEIKKPVTSKPKTQANLMSFFRKK